MAKKMNSQDLQTLINLNESLDNKDINDMVNASKIENPSLEIQGALTSFLVNKLDKLSRDDDFSDLIKMHIRQRLPEASFEDLMKLSHELNMDHTKSMEATLDLFKNETSGKNIIDNLRDNSVASTAQQLYDSTDNKDILQAVTYLSQVLEKVQTTNINITEKN